jgi:molybdate transport system ATP-binding protein
MRHRIGTLAIDVKFALKQPWTVLFGPSGSGKSTILRAIAGLVRPDSGRVAWSMGEAALFTKTPLTVTVMDSSRKQFVAAYARTIPLAPQAPTLFPHWTVVENLTMRRPSRLDEGQALELFRIAHLAGKRPAELSGGEAQRVNLARAATWTLEDGVLLLDEPFTGLDVALRSELMRDLKEWAANRNICVLSVTHDVAEAFQLGAEVIKIADGKVVAQGPVEVVLAEERKRLLEQLGGVNLA